MAICRDTLQKCESARARARYRYFSREIFLRFVFFLEKETRENVQNLFLSSP